MKQERVQDWMSSKVITVTRETNLPEVHQLMVSATVRRLPVVDEDGTLCGIVTLGDMRAAQPSPATSLGIGERNYLLSNLTVERIMTADPVTIHPAQSIGEAAEIMLEKRVSGLPVINDDGAICGIITESDIFRMVVRHQWKRE
jgi:acetoin utilization protein AcuB